MSYPAAQTPRLVAHLADDCDAAGFDLWAANLRACLTLPTSADQAQATRAEVLRLIEKPSIQALHKAGSRTGEGVGTPTLMDGCQVILDRLQVEWPADENPAQPLYEAVRNLADQLQLDGQARWLARLRYVALDRSFTAATRLERLDHVICSALMDESLPLALLTACRVRLEAIVDPELSAAMAAFALWPPAPKPSLAQDPEDQGASPVFGDTQDGPVYRISTEEIVEGED